SAAGREIDTVFVEGAEPAGPVARHVPLPDNRILAADVAQEVDRPVDEHPPVVCVRTLVEQLDPGLDVNLDTARDQFGELAASQAVEEAERVKLVDKHQIVPR